MRMDDDVELEFAPMVAGVPKGVFPGAMIGDKYRIEREIARGGQGIVVEATHLRLRQPVAIKFPHVQVDEALEAECHERMFREARAAFRLRNEHVARVIDVDIVDGAPFIVMELLRGTDLRKLIATRGPLPCDEAVGLILQACEGLAEAHDLGLIHRDLKPSNLFLVDRSNEPPLLKILDFGLAKQMTVGLPSADDPDLTEPLIMIGSPRYMSPEQARNPRQTDVRTDIWSLGLVLQELLTGRPVFRARNKADVLALVLLKNPTPISLLRPDVPTGIERVLMRCLQKLPEHRFWSIRDLAEQLTEFAPPWAAESVERLRHKLPLDSAPSSPISALSIRMARTSDEDDLTPVPSSLNGADAMWKAATVRATEPASARGGRAFRSAAAIGLAAGAAAAFGLWWSLGIHGRGIAPLGLDRDGIGGQRPASPPSAALTSLSSPGASPPAYALQPLPTLPIEATPATRAPVAVADPVELPSQAAGGATPPAASPPLARVVASHPIGKRAPRGGRVGLTLASRGHASARHKTTAAASPSAGPGATEPRDMSAAENPLDGRK